MSLYNYSIIYSDDVYISIQRDGDNSFETIRIKDHKTISDLLEESRSILNFKKHDQLSAHKIPYDQCIDGSVPIRQIAHLGTIVIKCTGRRANHEDSATHNNQGLALIPVKQGRSSKEIRHRGDLFKSGVTGRVYATTADQDEIKSLNMRLKIESALNRVEGFVFKIVPEDYTHKCKESESTFTFFSKKEHNKKRSKILMIPYRSDLQPREALPCWGVRINNNVGKDNPSKKSHRSRNQGTGKIPVAIVTKTSFHQVREFGVNVTINEEAVKEAKKILKASTKQERQTTIRKFNDKYCSFVYSGKFFAGAWFATMTIAWCFEGAKRQDSAYLEKCAAEETEHYWSWETQRNRFSSYPPLRNKDPSVNVSMVNESDPRNLQKMCQIEEIIRNVKHCTVFPADWDDKSHFTPVYEIMKSQAEATKDEELRKVADIFRVYMKGKTIFSFFALWWVSAAISCRMTLHDRKNMFEHGLVPMQPKFLLNYVKELFKLVIQVLLYFCATVIYLFIIHLL